MLISQKLTGLRMDFISLMGCLVLSNSLFSQERIQDTITAADILGNSTHLGISYGGYRALSRDVQPSINQIKADIRILYTMGIRLLRTYNVNYPHAHNVLKAIRMLHEEDPSIEMYLVLGTWINCKNAYTPNADHTQESPANAIEIEKAIALANEYSDIVKIISVGNEAMVHWATDYFVSPNIILKWVNYLQELKAKGKLPSYLWITSSDNFASWGGGDSSYQNEDLIQLIKAVDYLSIHTYPYHDTHYNPAFWEVAPENTVKSKKDRLDYALQQAVIYSANQYKQVKKYMLSLGVNKPIHIGETGWSTASIGKYGKEGSKAADEYKQALFYEKILQWSKKNKISCIYFSAFDEPWKDPNGPLASENNFGLFTVDGKAKYVLWSLVDKGLFEGLSREESGPPIVKTYGGDFNHLWNNINLPIYEK